jgi:tripartite-type tricarboxylate transporter receptor subunit TctC
MGQGRQGCGNQAGVTVVLKLLSFSKFSIPFGLSLSKPRGIARPFDKPVLSAVEGLRANGIGLSRIAKRSITAALLGLLLCAAAAAQNYPVKPVRIIIGFPPGGATDIAARAVAQKLTESFGQQVIVDNRPGAASNIGAEAAARAAPDGYTLFMGSVSTSINPSLYTKLAYDPLRDFATVALVANTPFLLVTHPSVPVKSVKELIAFVKARQGELNYATAGAGSGAHLFMELFMAHTGLKMTNVAYRGAAAATTDVLAGQVPMMFDNIFTTLPLVRGGKFRALAVSTPQRSAIAPEIPSVAEAGVPGYDANAWFGLFAPAAVPKDLITRLNAEVVKGLQTADMRERLRALGATPGGGTPEQFSAFLRDEVAKWAKVVKAAVVKLD